jgi:hypothetical protein
VAGRGPEEETLRGRVALVSAIKGLAHMCHDCQLGGRPRLLRGQRARHDQQGVAAARSLGEVSPTPTRREDIRLLF